MVKEAAELRYVRVNRACEELLSVDHGALVGKRSRDAFPAQIAETLEAHDRLALAGRGVFDVPEEILVSTGRAAPGSFTPSGSRFSTPAARPRTS